MLNKLHKIPKIRHFWARDGGRLWARDGRWSQGFDSAIFVFDVHHSQQQGKFTIYNYVYIYIYIYLSLSFSVSLSLSISDIRALSHLRYLSHSIQRNVIKHAGSSHTSTVRPHSNFLHIAGLALCGIPFCSSKDWMKKMSDSFAALFTLW